MKTFKHIDWLISLSLIVISVVVIVMRREAFFYGYFFVGGWQAISMLVHECSGWFIPKGSLRRTYHRIVFVIVAMGLSAFVYSILAYISLFVGFILLFVATLMALFYTKMCYDEWKSLVRRPLSVLK